MALTLDGISLGVIICGIQLLVLAGRPGRVGTVGSLYWVARLLVGHHVRLGVAGGYILGVTLAAIRCLCG